MKNTLSDLEITNRIKSMEWEKWLERPWQGFILSLFDDASRPESFEQIGVSGVELRVQFAQDGCWFLNQELLHEMSDQLGKFYDSYSFIKISESFSEFSIQSLSTLDDLNNTDIDIVKKYEIILNLLSKICTYIWLTHGTEIYLKEQLYNNVPRYIDSDVEMFISESSFPTKKAAHSLMEDMMRSSATNEDVQKQFGWLKNRDGFTGAYSIAEIAEMRASLNACNEHKFPVIPTELQYLISEMQELIYFRTARTDLFFQILSKAKPIFEEIATQHKITYDQMQYYHSKSLLTKKPIKYAYNPTFIYLDGNLLFCNDPIIEDAQLNNSKVIKGMSAYKGIVRGKVVIIKNTSELNKMSEGNILVTQMTFPAFLPAMIKASAFVTDEGGITCHAAIIAREMNKPCITGTKIATKLLKDGDMVEVDANTGIVRKI
jgi:phosphohistidine swiveling domain-containing protein